MEKSIVELSSSAVMAGAQGFTEAVKEFWFLTGFRRGNPRILIDWI
jgi:hypothetical protein